MLRMADGTAPGPKEEGKGKSRERHGDEEGKGKSGVRHGDEEGKGEGRGGGVEG